MRVKILTGRAGRLTPLMLREIAQARQAGKRVLVLVPEQFTLLMEREIMDGLHLPGLMDVEVLCLSGAAARPRGCWMDADGPWP